MTRNGENFEKRPEVWRLHRQGVSQREIGRRLGLARTSVQRILASQDPDQAHLSPLQRLLSGVPESESSGLENPVPNPMDDLANEVRADIAAMRAKVAEDGIVTDGKRHPLLSEIRQSEALLARIFKDMN